MARFSSSGKNGGEPGYKTSLDLNIWRIIGSGMCTLEQAQSVYNYTDMLDFHEYLNLKEYLEDREIEKARQDAKKK